MYKGMKVLYVIDGVIEGKQHNIEQALPNRYSLSLSLSLSSVSESHAGEEVCSERQAWRLSLLLIRQW
jgi:hypothetical protein